MLRELKFLYGKTYCGYVYFFLNYDAHVAIDFGDVRQLYPYKNSRF